MAVSFLLSRATDLQETRQPQMLRETIPFVALASISVGGRFASRRIQRVAFGADDYMIVVALILTWVHFTLLAVDLSFGVGKHTEVEPKENPSRVAKMIFAGSIVYGTAMATNKLAILLLYQRIFNTPKFILVTKIVGWFVIAWWFAVVIIQIFSCKPVNGFWDFSIPSTCINASHFYVGVAVPNISTDIVMLALPVRMVWRLQTSRFQKIGLSAIFLTGGFVIVASSYRVFWLLKASRTDLLWTYVGVVIWTSIEPSVGVICACLPTLRPLLREIVHKGRHWGETAYSSGIRSQHRHGTKLDSGFQTVQGAKPPTQGRWIDDNLGFRPKNDMFGEAAVTSSMSDRDPERDTIPLVGITVRQDVRIDHTSLLIHSTLDTE